DLALLAQDIDGYAQRGATLYAMMHPGRHPTAAEMLMNRAMARLTFSGGDAAALQADFESALFGGAPEAAAALRGYTQALRQRSALFGAEFSLNLVLNADYAWSPPPIGADEMRAAISAFLDGGVLRLKPLRIGFLAPLTDQVEPLASVLAGLDDSVALAQRAAARGGSQGAVAERLAQEIGRARAIVAHLNSFAQARLAGLSGRKEACLAMLAPMGAQLAALDAMAWPEYVSDFQMRSRYIKTQRALLDFLRAKGCAAGAP
ncbi:MAG: hypothetical protein ACRCTD_05530, partial [Beijerinckiaceae bacterium]